MIILTYGLSCFAAPKIDKKHELLVFPENVCLCFLHSTVSLARSGVGLLPPLAGPTLPCHTLPYPTLPAMPQSGKTAMPRRLMMTIFFDP